MCFNDVLMYKCIFDKLSPNKIFISIVAAVISIVLAIVCRVIREYVGDVTIVFMSNIFAYCLVSLWVLFPPVWFILEFTFDPIAKSAPDVFKYNQELAKNVWIALVAVLSVITGVVGFK